MQRVSKPFWTAEEDSALRALHAQHLAGRLSNDEFWAAAQSQLPARTPASVSGRLVRVGLQAPPQAGAGAHEEVEEGGSGRDENGERAPAGTCVPAHFWTAEEDRALRALHAKNLAGRLSNDEFWASAKAQLPTRKQLAVTKRLQRMGLLVLEVCKPARLHTAGGHALWTAAEDSTLAALHAQHKAIGCRGRGLGPRLRRRCRPARSWR